MSNIYLKVTLEKNCCSQYFDFTSLQISEKLVLHKKFISSIMGNFLVYDWGKFFGVKFSFNNQHKVAEE